MDRTLRLIVMILLIILLIGLIPTWPYSSNWGWYPSGGVGLLLVIVLVIALLGGGRLPPARL